MKDKILKEIKNTFPDFKITKLFKDYINQFVNDIFEEMKDNDNYSKDNIKKYLPSDFVLIDCAFYLRYVHKVGNELYPKDENLFFILKDVVKSDIAKFLAELEYCEYQKELVKYVKLHKGLFNDDKYYFCGL